MFKLTDNEMRAALVLVKSCLHGMGGERPSDLEQDEYTWVDVSDLTEAGWTRHEAIGTFGSLIDKGVVQQYDRNSWVLTTAAWKWLDTVWEQN